MGPAPKRFRPLKRGITVRTSVRASGKSAPSPTKQSTPKLNSPKTQPIITKKVAAVTPTVKAPPARQGAPVSRVLLATKKTVPAANPVPPAVAVKSALPVAVVGPQSAPKLSAPRAITQHPPVAERAHFAPLNKKIAQFNRAPDLYSADAYNAIMSGVKAA
jgi:hypothetical protein